MPPGTNPITITVSHGPTVSKDPVTMADDGDEAVFVANPATPNLKFDVHFETTPFDNSHFHNKSTNAHRTGKYRSDKKGTHKYTVTIDGEPPLDPVIIVSGP
jgi:hypothetical protein